MATCTATPTLAAPSSILIQVVDTEGRIALLRTSGSRKTLKGVHRIKPCNNQADQDHRTCAKEPERKGILYHLHTLHLFTSSDYKVVLLPHTVFGVVSALSGSFIADTNAKLTAQDVASQLPLLLAWIYLNLLPFTLRNQSTPSAIAEDALNKPHRPLPSGRLTRSTAHALGIIFYALAILMSIPLETSFSSITLLLLGSVYHDLRGGDSSPLSRNLINALGHGCFSLGATVIASGGKSINTTALYQWLGIIMMIIVTTIQLQDLPDQKGDALRNRKTLPLTLGDVKTRWSVAVPVLIWSIVVLRFWESGITSSIIVLAMGAGIAARVLLARTVKADKTTWLLWTVWLTLLFFLPLARCYGV